MHNFIIKALPLFTFLLLQSLAFSQGSKGNEDLLAAFSAQGSLQLKESNSLFKKVVSSPTATDEDKCTALRQLAIQDWKFYNDYKAAKTKIAQADSIGDYLSETWLVLNRVERESGHFTNALEAARQSIELSVSKADKIYAQYKYCQTILRQALHQANSNKEINEDLLLEASRRLQEVLAVNPTNANAAEVLLGVALLCKDGDLALKAWLSYFRFTNAQNAYSYLQPVANTLQNILPNWKGEISTLDEKVLVAQALGKSGFYNYAKVLTYGFGESHSISSLDNVELQNIIAYANYLNDVKAYTNEYYRKTTVGEPITDDYMDLLMDKNEQLYDLLTNSEIKKDTFSFGNFRSLIRSGFGTVLMVGQTSSSNVPSLVMGQIVNERVRSVEQYGHTADFNFTELDMMTSNGYPSWFWEDRGAGGFAIPGGFIRVKKMFKHLGIDAWERVTDSVKRGKHLEKIETHLLSSTKESTRNSILLGLSRKLELDALDAIYERLVDTGLSGLELQLKFIETYDDYRDNATMFAHEGRHSLDRIALEDGYRELGIPTIEYRARLSQIAFSESPKLELANMINGVGTTGAGLSNKMIVEVAEQWLAVNSSDVAEFDATKLPISQLYRLTEEQIKNCFRAVDPFYLALKKL